MFSFGEIAVVLVIAMFVLGPENLPKAARTLGRYWQQASKFIDNAKEELTNMMNEPEPQKQAKFIEIEDNQETFDNQEQRKPAESQNKVESRDNPYEINHAGWGEQSEKRN